MNRWKGDPCIGGGEFGADDFQQSADPVGALFGADGPVGGFEVDVDDAGAAAVARWELLLGRPVPEPTQPGRHGSPVLAPAFVEWLMGLPSGWVSGLGLPRTAAHGCSATASSSNRPLSRCGCCYARTTGR
jgi:hypothetical protein